MRLSLEVCAFIKLLCKSTPPGTARSQFLREGWEGWRVAVVNLVNLAVLRKVINFLRKKVHTQRKSWHTPMPVQHYSARAILPQLTAFTEKDYGL